MNDSRYPNLSEFYSHSLTVINKAQGFVSSMRTNINDYVCPFIVGSYGRLEASEEASDLEWLLIYDDKKVNKQEADIYQARLTEGFANIIGRDRLSIGKTFGEIATITDLFSNIGGIADSNRMLTYRMLVFADGTPLLRNKTYEKAIQTLALSYGGSHTGGYRLLSLATDIARYWRTLRIDYKQKVDEDNLPWAIRMIKLRTARRLWYYSIILHFIAFGPRTNHGDDEILSVQETQNFLKEIELNPCDRLTKSIKQFNGETAILEKTLTLYEEISKKLSSAENRLHLNSLNYENRAASKLYQDLRGKCKEFHTLLAELTLSLPQWPKTEIIEMFLL